MAEKKTLTVDYVGGVCLREAPSTKAKIVKILQYGEKVKLAKEDAPAGWIAVDGGGFTMEKYLR